MDQIDAGFGDELVRVFVDDLWAAAPSTLLVFAASALRVSEAYVLVAGDWPVAVCGLRPRGLRRRLLPAQALTGVVFGRLTFRQRQAPHETELQRFLTHVPWCSASILVA
jgi:hypothetical protein